MRQETDLLLHIFLFFQKKKDLRNFFIQKMNENRITAGEEVFKGLRGMGGGSNLITK